MTRWCFIQLIYLFIFRAGRVVALWDVQLWGMYCRDSTLDLRPHWGPKRTEHAENLIFTKERTCASRIPGTTSGASAGGVYIILILSCKISGFNPGSTRPDGRIRYLLQRADCGSRWQRRCRVTEKLFPKSLSVLSRPRRHFIPLHHPPPRAAIWETNGIICLNICTANLLWKKKLSALKKRKSPC